MVWGQATVPGVLFWHRLSGRAVFSSLHHPRRGSSARVLGCAGLLVEGELLARSVADGSCESYVMNQRRSASQPRSCQ